LLYRWGFMGVVEEGTCMGVCQMKLLLTQKGWPAPALPALRN